jgi:hypothetical protein
MRADPALVCRAGLGVLPKTLKYLSQRLPQDAWREYVCMHTLHSVCDAGAVQQRACTAIASAGDVTGDCLACHTAGAACRACPHCSQPPSNVSSTACASHMRVQANPRACGSTSHPPVHRLHIDLGGVSGHGDVGPCAVLHLRGVGDAKEQGHCDG